MITFNLYANDTVNESSEFVADLTAANIDELSEKYGLKLFEQDENFISALDKSEIAKFLSANNIDFDLNSYDEIYLHVAA
jgi:hypothetical protein